MSVEQLGFLSRRRFLPPLIPSANLSHPEAKKVEAAKRRIALKRTLGVKWRTQRRNSLWEKSAIELHLGDATSFLSGCYA